MIRLSILTMIFLCSFCAEISYASDAKETVTVNQDNIKQLIETLESETARSEFIANLKTLQEAQNKDRATEPSVPILSEALGIENQTQQFLTEYTDFLARHNLNGSMVGKLGLSLGALLLALFLSLANDKANILMQRLAHKARVQFALPHARLNFYVRVLRHVGQVVIMALLVYGLTAIWDFHPFAFIQGEMGSTIMIGALSVFTVVAIAIALWEVISGSIDVALKRANDRNASRLRTLLPIVRNVLFMVFAVLFALVVLSEVGINIMPLLAGAGIVGVAIGFGAQTMVKDFLSGFTIILEDLFHIGDVIRIDQFTGTVEEITLRKVQIRDVHGTVVTIPYSALTVIENLTKDFSYYVLDIAVAYDADIDQVVDVMQMVDSKIRHDEVFAAHILEPIEIMGVERFMDSSIIIRARVKTKPSQQWSVGREYNRRIRDAFAVAGIEIPFPQQVVHNKTA